MSKVQNDIIADIDNNVSVAAGAGTGKTYTLTHRFVNILEQNAAQPGFSIANVVAITFTRAAATEMRECTRKVLQERIDVTGNGRLQKFLLNFDKAKIMTIDSLQGKILREHPVEAGVDPNFQVQDEVEYADTVQKLTNQFLHREAKRGNPDLTRLVCIFGFGKLRSDFVSLAQTSRQSVLLQGTPEAVTGRIFDFLKKSDSNDKASGEKSPESEATGEPDRFAAERELALVWLRVYRQYAAYLEQEKNNLDILGFNDVALRCVSFLKKYDEVRHDYQKLYRYIMVDEFQDTNDSQREFVYLLCGDPKDGSEPGSRLCGRKLFVVGDYKQSIYGFRDADVRVFEKVCRHIKEAGGRGYDITENRRSTDKILQFTNFVFAQEHMLGEKYSPLTVFEGNKHSGDRPTSKPLVRCFVHRKEEKKEKAEKGNKQEISDRETEAEYVAQYIEDLLKQGKRLSSITILLAKMTRLPDLLPVLIRHSIPYVILGGKDFYKRQEIFDILNILRVLENPDNDVALLGVLRSPYFGWSDVEITKLCDRAKVNSCGHLWEALEDGAVKDKLEKLCLAAKCLPVLELWQILLESLRADFILNRQTNGRQLWANVLKLRDLCQKYCTQHGTGIKGWLNFLDGIMKNSKEKAADLSAADAVKIMTVHKSKGLGFEEVILPFLGDTKDANYTESVSIDQEQGYFAVKDADGETDSFKAVQEQNNRKTAEEKIRLFYVAVTRAKKGLYMSGPATDLVKLEHPVSFMAKLQKALTDSFGVLKPEAEPFCRWETIETDGTVPAAESFKAETAKQFHYSELPAVKRQQQIFTPSMLQCYLQCQRRYYYQYVWRLPPVDVSVLTVNQGSAVRAVDVGTLLHRALELYKNDGTGGLMLARQELQFVCADPVWQEIEELFVHYVQSQVFQAIPAEHEREVAFQLPLQDGVIFKGIIDCLYRREDGSYGIVDYKTGQVPESLNRGYALQLVIYGRAVELLKRGRAAELLLHYLRGPKVFKVDFAENSFADAVALAREIGAKQQEADFMCDGDCRNCGYVYVCRKDGGRN